MTRREYIHELIEPRNDSCISRLYDYVMLVVIVIGIFPLYSISDIGRVISIISSMVGIGYYSPAIWYCNSRLFG